MYNLDPLLSDTSFYIVATEITASVLFWVHSNNGLARHILMIIFFRNPKQTNGEKFLKMSKLLRLGMVLF